MYALFYTSASGQTKDLLNYVIILAQEPEECIEHTDDQCSVLAFMSITGASRDDLIDQFKAVYHKVLLKPKHSPWDF